MRSTTGEHFLRQLSASNGVADAQEEWQCNNRRGSRRWGSSSSSSSKKTARSYYNGNGYCRKEETMVAGKKRVMVVVDESSGAKHAMMWALTHVANKGDFLTLLHILPPCTHSRGEEASSLANSLGTLCKACKPEVEVEALVIQGPKLATVLSQVKKLEASVLVISQRKRSPFCCFMPSRSEEFIEQCINKAECLTLAVRKQSKGVGGYLISTRWQKNFWLLA